MTEQTAEMADTASTAGIRQTHLPYRFDISSHLCAGNSPLKRSLQFFLTENKTPNHILRRKIHTQKLKSKNVKKNWLQIQDFQKIIKGGSCLIKLKDDFTARTTDPCSIIAGR